MFLGTVSSKKKSKGLTIQELNQTAVSLGLLENQPAIQRRIARAHALLQDNKVAQIDDEIFRVYSQFEKGQSYIVETNSMNPHCTCPDAQDNRVFCKHQIAARLYAAEVYQQQSKALTIYDDTANSYHKRGRWWVTDYKRKTKYIVYRDGNGRLICPCGKKKDCEHRKAIREYTNNNGDGNGSKITNECGSESAKQLQDQFNGQLNKSGDNGNGDTKSPSQPQLDISDPFQECELKDIAQIEGKALGELAWKLSNGEYVISYKGIMTLAEKHNIEFSVSMDNKTNTVIARAKNGNERISGKEVRICGFATTASELAKRNAARQLLPLAEIKAVEHKAKLNAEFDWQTAYTKCVEIVGGKAQVDIIINDLVNWGKLRQDNPSGYNRTEWLLIHEYCTGGFVTADNHQKEASISRDPGSTNNWSYNSSVFIDRCREAIQKVRDDNTVEAAELPMEGSNGKRKLQMDKRATR